MNSKQIFKNQDLFTFVFIDEPITHPRQFQLALNSNFRDEIKKDISETPGVQIDAEKYCEYTLSMEVGNQFFYSAFIRLLKYRDRIDFLNYQLEQCEDKMSLLHRVEAFSQADYWYKFGEYSYYNPEVEQIIADWCIAKYSGKEPKQRTKLQLIKP